MPSRERVVTTITTADHENGEGVVISETVEIESLPNKDATVAAKPDDATASPPSSQGPNASESNSNSEGPKSSTATQVHDIESEEEHDRGKSQPKSSADAKSKTTAKRQKKGKSPPANQRTLGSFFFKPQSTSKPNSKSQNAVVKPKASSTTKAQGSGSKMKAGSATLTTPKVAKKKITNEPAASSLSSSKKLSKVITPTPIKSALFAVTAKATRTPASSPTGENPTANQAQNQTQPTSLNKAKTFAKSESSIHTTKPKSHPMPMPLTTTPSEDILSIVLGAHGDTPPKPIAPPTQTLDQDIDIDAPLPKIKSPFLLNPNSKHLKGSIRSRMRSTKSKITKIYLPVRFSNSSPPASKLSMSVTGELRMSEDCEEVVQQQMSGIDVPEVSGRGGVEASPSSLSREENATPCSDSDLTSARGPSPSSTLYPNRTSDGDADANIVGNGNGKGIGKVTRPRAPTVNELRPRKKKRVELQTLKPEELGLESEFTVTSKSSVGSVANAMDVESLSKPVVSEMDTENDVDVDMVTQTQAQACINELQPKKGSKIHVLQLRKKVKKDKDQGPEAGIEVKVTGESGHKEAVAVAVNTLRPRKKKDVVMAQHAMDAEVNAPVALESDGEKDKVHTLQPRNKQKELKSTVVSKEISEDVNFCTPKPESVPDNVSKDIAKEEDIQTAPAETNANHASSQEDEVQVEEATANQLQPRKKKTAIPTSKPAPSSKKASTSTGVGAKKGITGAKKNKSNNTVSTTAQPPKQSISIPKVVTPPVLSAENKALVSKYHAMLVKYVDRGKELIDRGLAKSLPEENFAMDGVEDILKAPTIEAKVNAEIVEFRNEWVDEIASIVQGSSLPIEELAKIVHHKIMTSLVEGNAFITVEAIASKIKLLAERTQYLFSIPDIGKKGADSKVDIFSNTNFQFMWRWELISLDYLPKASQTVVKKARAARRKLKNHQKAVTRLVQALIDIITSIQSKASDTKILKLVAKVSTEEERVLKYEREEEKARLLSDAKKQKELARKQKELEQKRLEEEKRKEKELLEDTRKAEKAKILEEKKRKQNEAKLEKANKEKKQKNRMLSFFKPTPSTSKRDTEIVAACPLDTPKSEKLSSFDGDKFWSSLGSDEAKVADRPFAKVLSVCAIRSKRRKIGTVNVRVFVPTISENPFKQDVYDEERIIPIRNRYKYLSFREDYRPPYHGTWSKPKSTTISGRNPFAKDVTFLDYDVDSEAEWEEGDDDEGEDCSENGNEEEDMIDDEEGDTTKYNYQDGWLAQDGDLVLEDDDEETQELRKRKMSQNNSEAVHRGGEFKFTAACVIAPLYGGIPFARFDNCQLNHDVVEGMTSEAARDLMSLHQYEILEREPICLDPLPPRSKTTTKKSDSTNQKALSQKMTRDDLITFAKFVHNSNLSSKDMVVEALRNAHKDITTSRAQATRKLDSMASKRRLKNGGGVIWEIKNEILESLGLHHLVKEPESENDLTSTKEKSPLIQETKSKASTKSKNNAKKGGSVTVSTKTENLLCPEKTAKPILVSPKEVSPKRKRKNVPVTKATVNLLTSFLKKKKAST